MLGLILQSAEHGIVMSRDVGRTKSLSLLLFYIISYIIIVVVTSSLPTLHNCSVHSCYFLECCA